MQLQYSLIAVIVLGGHYCVCFEYEDTTLQPTKQPTFHFTTTVSTCSDSLARLIDEICNNVYRIVKRDTSPLIARLLPEDLNNKIRERAFESEKWQRIRRQVATECCDHVCTIADVINYCADDSKLILKNPQLFGRSETTPSHTRR